MSEPLAEASSSTTYVYAAASAVVTAIVTPLFSLAIERLGGSIGGVLASSPSAIIPATLGLFFGASSPDVYRASVTGIPGGILANAILLVVYTIVPRYLFVRGSPSRGPLAHVPFLQRCPPFVLVTVLALIGWLIVAVLAAAGVQAALAAGHAPFTVDTAILGCIAVLAGAACWKAPAAVPAAVPSSFGTLVLRGLVAALPIGSGCAFAAAGFPTISASVTTLPGIPLVCVGFVGAIHGPSVAAGAAAGMAAGCGSVALYALVATMSLPALGAPVGSVVAWVSAVVGWSLPAFVFLRWRARRASADAPSMSLLAGSKDFGASFTVVPGATYLTSPTSAPGSALAKSTLGPGDAYLRSATMLVGRDVHDERLDERLLPSGPAAAALSVDAWAAHAGRATRADVGVGPLTLIAGAATL